MRTLQHPRLIQLYDAFEADNIMCVILELIEGGELFERVIDDDFILTEKACTIFMRQICEGVEFIHRKNILHLDLKPENILCLTKTGNRIKIIDFGLARKYEPDKKLQVLFGTPEFVAPEVVNFDQISFATDMWSVGVICYVLLSGLSPFMGETDIQTMSNVTLALYDFDDEAFDDISAEAKDFIAKLLTKSQAYRMTASQCLAHPWLQKKVAPKLQIQCLEPAKENLRTYVENFTPHNGINFINKAEDKNRMDPILQIIESDKRNINQNILRPFRKDSLINSSRNSSNDNMKHSIRSQITIQNNENLIENSNSFNDINYTNDMNIEKPVRYKMTLTPLGKPINLLQTQENNFFPTTNSQVIVKKLVENINSSELNETDSKTNISSLEAILENQIAVSKNFTDAEKTSLIHQRSLNESIKSLSNLPSNSSSTNNTTQSQSGNLNGGVKHRIVIPPVFGENRAITLLNNKECETPFPFSMDKNQGTVIKDENKDIKWPEVLITIMKKKERFGNELSSNNFNNKPTNISENSSSIKNTVIKYDRNVGNKKNFLSYNLFENENFITISQSAMGKESSSTTDISNAIKSYDSGCKKLMALPPRISINDKWKNAENISKTLLQNPTLSTDRHLTDTKEATKTNTERSLSLQSSINSNLQDIFLKPKLKSTPPWFSEMQEKSKETEITNVRRKFKFTSTHRDVPLGTPVNFDIGRFVCPTNYSANITDVLNEQKHSSTVEEISLNKSNYPIRTNSTENE
ncbi:uncharacterized protein isoform X2 [Rhodnius prolixus]